MRIFCGETSPDLDSYGETKIFQYLKSNPSIMFKGPKSLPIFSNSLKLSLGFNNVNKCENYEKAIEEKMATHELLTLNFMNCEKALCIYSE